MSFWQRWFGGTTDNGSSACSIPEMVINPSTGLPMANNDIGGVDVGGSPYGQDIHPSPPTFDLSSSPWIDPGNGSDW